MEFCDSLRRLKEFLYRFFMWASNIKWGWNLIPRLVSDEESGIMQPEKDIEVVLDDWSWWGC